MENLKNNAMLTDQEGIENEDFEIELDVNDELEIDLDWGVDEEQQEEDNLDSDSDWGVDEEQQEEDNLELDSDWGVDEEQQEESNLDSDWGVDEEQQEESNLDLDSDWGADEEKEETKAANEEQLGEINLDDFVSLTDSSKQRGKGGVKGGLSIVNAKTGQRVSLCSDIWSHLGEPQELQFRAGKKQLLISPVMNSNAVVWKLPDNAEKAILYRAGLVNSLTEAYQLDFSTKSSLSFTKYEKLYHQGYPVVLVNM